MQASNRIIVNTIAQYLRTIINVLLSLYSARLVLLILGQSDFGLYSLIAGVVALLSFLTNSLVASTQRFLNVNQGIGDLSKVKEIFCNSLILHLILGAFVIVVFESITPLLFNGFLNIPDDRENVALILYHLVVGMVFLSFITAPFRALLVSRENIVYISIIDVLDGVLKLILVLLLPYSRIDMLVTYGWIMFGIQSFNLFSFAIFDFFKYEECVLPSNNTFSKNSLKNICSFGGWILYGSFCIAMRNQGFAIVINKILGTVANAAYGIGNSIASYVSFISTSFTTAIGPQLMKAEGINDRTRMMTLAKIQSKLSYLLLGAITIPVCFAMSAILTVWLKKVPENAEIYSIMVLLGLLIDQPTSGLGTTVQAIGKMGFYTIIVFTPKFLILPISWFVLKNNGSVIIVSFVFVMIEGVCMLFRLWLAKRLVNYSILDFLKTVFIPIVWPTLVCVIACVVIKCSIASVLGDLLVLVIGSTLFFLITYLFSLSVPEKQKVKSIVRMATIKFTDIIKI